MLNHIEKCYHLLFIKNMEQDDDALLEDGSFYAQMATGKAQDILDEWNDLLAPSAWPRVWEEVLNGCELEDLAAMIEFVNLQVLHCASAFYRRCMQPVMGLPGELMYIVAEPMNVKSADRERIARKVIALAGDSPCPLDIITRRIYSFFNADFHHAAATGHCNRYLYVFLKMMWFKARDNVQLNENYNRLSKVQTERSVGINHGLLSSRLNIKKKLGVGTNCGPKKFIMRKERGERVHATCVDNVEEAGTIMQDIHRFTTPTVHSHDRLRASVSAAEWGRLFPQERITSVRTWGAAFNLVWHHSARKATLEYGYFLQSDQSVLAVGSQLHFVVDKAWSKGFTVSCSIGSLEEVDGRRTGRFKVDAMPKAFSTTLDVLVAVHKSAHQEDPKTRPKLMKIVASWESVGKGSFKLDSSEVLCRLRPLQKCTSSAASSSSSSSSVPESAAAGDADADAAASDMVKALEMGPDTADAELPPDLAVAALKALDDAEEHFDDVCHDDWEKKDAVALDEAAMEARDLEEVLSKIGNDDEGIEAGDFEVDPHGLDAMLERLRLLKGGDAVPLVPEEVSNDVLKCWDAGLKNGMNAVVHHQRMQSRECGEATIALVHFSSSMPPDRGVTPNSVQYVKWKDSTFSWCVLVRGDGPTRAKHTLRWPSGPQAKSRHVESHFSIVLADVGRPLEFNKDMT